MQSNIEAEKALLGTTDRYIGAVNEGEVVKTFKWEACFTSPLGFRDPEKFVKVELDAD